MNVPARFDPRCHSMPIPTGSIHPGGHTHRHTQDDANMQRISKVDECHFFLCNRFLDEWVTPLNPLEKFIENMPFHPETAFKIIFIIQRIHPREVMSPEVANAASKFLSLLRALTGHDPPQGSFSSLSSSCPSIQRSSLPLHLRLNRCARPLLHPPTKIVQIEKKEHVAFSSSSPCSCLLCCLNQWIMFIVCLCDKKLSEIDEQNRMRLGDFRRMSPPMLGDRSELHPVIDFR